MRQLKIIPSVTDRSNASLDKYLSEVNNETMISAEEEVLLAQKIRMGDHYALDKMVKANLRFVISVAKQYQGRGMPLTDLISEGNLGLIKAAQRFDETRGFKFISYAVWWIRQGIIQCIAQQSRTIRLPINQIYNIHKINKAFAELEQKNEREPTAEELAEVLELSIEGIETSIQNTAFPVSLDAPVRDTGDTNFLDLLLANDAKDTDSDLMYESLKLDIKQILLCLNKMEKDVIIQFFGIDLDKSVSLSNIAYQHNFTTERIRQIKNRALYKLKATIEKRSLKTLI